MRNGLLILAIAAGGALGASSRHVLSGLLRSEVGLSDHVSIMLVNGLGCLLIGLVFMLLEGLLLHHRPSRLRDAGLAVGLRARGWWPEADPTAPVVETFAGDRLARLLSGLLVTGFLGGMTTFSLFSLLALQLAGSDQWMALLLNVTGTLLLGWAGVHSGLRLGRSIVLLIRRPVITEGDRTCRP